MSVRRHCLPEPPSIQIRDWEHSYGTGVMYVLFDLDYRSFGFLHQDCHKIKVVIACLKTSSIRSGKVIRAFRHLLYCRAVVMRMR